MNLSYKLVKSKQSGELVVASELAKGHKKSTRKVIAASLVLIGSMGYAQTSSSEIDLSGIKYESGTFTGGTAKPLFNHINNKSQEQLAKALEKKKLGQKLSAHEERITKQHFLINDGNTHSVKFGNSAVTRVDMPKAEYFQEISNTELQNSGAIKIYRKSDLNNAIDSIPDWDNLDYALRSHTWSETENGAAGSINVHDLKDLGKVSANLSNIKGTVLKKQPPVPYFNFNVVTATSGTIDLKDTKTALNWNFGQIKQSSLFTADSTEGQKTAINVGDVNASDAVNMTVVFQPGYKASAKDTQLNNSYNYGATKVFAGEFENNDLVTALTNNGYDAAQLSILLTATNKFNVTNLESLQAYQSALIWLAERNLFLQTDYDSHFNQAFKTIAQEYTVKVDYDASANGGLYLGDIFNADVGMLSILKATGANSEININKAKINATNGQIAYLDQQAQIVVTKDADLLANSGNVIEANNGSKATIEQGAKVQSKGGRIFKGSNNSTATNSADTTIGDGHGNVALNASSSYTNAKGTTLTYQSNFITDDVTGNSTFNNEGTVVVGESSRHDGIARGATTISGNSQYINHTDAKLYVGANDKVNSNAVEHSSSKLANGVVIKNSGSFTNNGEAFLGKKTNGTNSNITYKLPDSPTENDLLLKDTNNIVAALLNKTGDTVTIRNTGAMTIGDVLTKTSDPHIQHAVGINVQQTGNQSNKVQVINDGTITVGGYHTAGIRVTGKIGSESDLTNRISNTATGTINVIGANSIGLYATSGATAHNEGTINVGGTITKDIDGKDIITRIDNSQLDRNMVQRNYGLKAEGATIYNSGEINLLADNSVGAYARVGGLIQITGDGSAMLTTAPRDNVVYFWISGKNGAGKSSTIDFTAPKVTLSSQDTNSTFFRIDQGATFDVSGMGAKEYELTMSGFGSTGLYVASKDTIVNIDNGMTFNISGENATGIYVTSNAGTGKGNVSLGKDAKISVTGKNSSAAVVDGMTYDLNNNPIGTGTAILNSAALLDGTKIDFDKGAVGYKLINNGKLNHTGTIDFTGAKAAGSAQEVVGIHIEGGILNNSKDAKVEVNGVGVDIYSAKIYKDASGNIVMPKLGEDIAAFEKKLKDANGTITLSPTSNVENIGNITATDGIAAVRINEGVTLNLKGQDGAGLITGHNEADAIRVHDGATLTTDNAQIAVDGEGAGIHFMNTDSTKESTFVLKGTGTIDVKGTGTMKGTGILVQGAGGKLATANFDSSESKLQINVKETGGHGITTNTSGYVYSGSNVTIESAQGGSALVVKGTTTDIKQSGNLISNSTNGPVVDLTKLSQDAGHTVFTNTGRIESTVVGGTAIAANLGKNLTLTNKDNGVIKGAIALGTGDNDITLYGGTTGDIFSVTPGSTGKTSVTLKNVLANTNHSNIIFNGLIAGDGNEDTLRLDNSHYTLTSTSPKTIQGFELLDIGTKSTFEIQNTDILLNESDTNPNSGIKFADKTSTLKVSDNKNITFNHKLIGEGLVQVDLGNNVLAMNSPFATFNSDNFTGTLALTNTKFTLRGDSTNENNAKTITKAMLNVGRGTVVDVYHEDGRQKIGGLSFGGGRVEFKDKLSNLVLTDKLGDPANSLMGVTTLDMRNASGTVQIILDHMQNLAKPDQEEMDKLLAKEIIEQDVGSSLVHLVASDKNIGVSVNKLILEMDYDNLSYLESQAVVQDIVQGINEEKVAEGTYDYGLELKEDGLHVSYALRVVNILGGKNFELRTNQASKDKDLTAQITGSGNLVIHGYDDISISNGGNTYTGQTIVDTGHFYLENDGVLGQTSNLHIKNGAQVSVLGRAGNQEGTEQVAGALNVEKGGLLTLGSEKGLTITGDKDFDSIIRGNLVGSTGAHLTFSGGYAAIHSTNNDLDTDVKLQNDAVVQIYDAAGLGQIGSVDIDADANLKVANHNPKSLFSKNLTGTGLFTVTTSVDANDNIIDSTVRLAGDNTSFTGNVVIGHNSDYKKSTLIIDEASMVGGTDILINRQGTLQLDHSGALDWNIDKNITGQGGLAKTGSGTVLLEQSASNYTGKTTVYGGTLIAGDGDDSYVHSGSELDIKSGAKFIGTAGIFSGSVMNHGEFIVGKTLIDEEDDQYVFTVKGDFINSGIIEMNNKNQDDIALQASRNQVNNYTSLTGNIGNELHILGNYISAGGAVILNTTLNDGFENTITDSIHVSGNVTRQGQSTRLFVQNYGGLGASTQADAIKIIHVDGVSDPTAFILGRPAAIGVYEYTLHKGGEEHWYLQTYVEPLVSMNPIEGLSSMNSGVQRNINPLVGGYLANMSAAFGMFNMTLHDRLGNPSYGQSFLNPDERGFSAWGRIVTSHQKYHAANHGLSISGDMYIAQVGADLIRVATEKDGSYRFGVMASYGSSDFKSRSRTTGTHAKGKIDQAGSIGLYGTWYQPEGWFVDAWLQYSHFKNEVSLQQQSSNKYNSNLWNASVEVGYNYKTDSFDNGDYLIIQPNAQVIVGRLSSKSYMDYTSGLRVDSHKKNNVHVRVGAKLFYVPKTSSDNGFRPYIEANWIHNSSNMSATFNNSYSYSSNAPKNIYELKVGVEGELSKDWSVWGNVGIQKGKNHYKGHKATLGVKYTW